MRKVYSQATPPSFDGEVFLKESLTDQLADEKLEDIVNRFMNAGSPLPGSYSDGLDLASAEDPVKMVDTAFDDFSTADVQQMDKVEQSDVLVTARRLVEQLQRQSAGKPIKSVDSEAGKSSPDVVVSDTTEPQKGPEMA